MLFMIIEHWQLVSALVTAQHSLHAGLEMMSRQRRENTDHALYNCAIEHDSFLNATAMGSCVFENKALQSAARMWGIVCFRARDGSSPSRTHSALSCLGPRPWEALLQQRHDPRLLPHGASIPLNPNPIRLSSDWRCISTPPRSHPPPAPTRASIPLNPDPIRLYSHLNLIQRSSITRPPQTQVSTAS